MDQTPSPSTGSQLAWLFLKLDGRISRAAYFLAGLLLAVIQAFILYRYGSLPEESAAVAVWASGFWIVFFISLWCGFVLGVKRVHDLNRHGAFAVFCVLFPFPAFLVLSLWPGDSGPNDYGPRTNAPATG
ncbi:MAG: DUF805 domain-containing protein [Rhizobiaceae bacterium]